MSGTHPPDGVLRDFALGRLGDPADADVEAHLSECPDCLARATEPGPPDTLVDLLAAAAARPDPTPAPADAAARTLTLAAGATPSQAPTHGFSGAGLGATLDGSDAPPAVLVGHPRYRPVRLLGVGGMGSVWLAEHAVMGRQVAVKVIRPELLARPLAAERFVREVRAAARLHHPNIVAAFDAEEAAGACLLVMEFVPGEPLSEVVQGGPLPVADACRVARDAAHGLAHAHAAGLVHRDVKPSNLIRTPDGITKVLDFGLVTDDDRPVGLTGDNIVMGTPDYIAPEQADDAHTADARADVYGLGCTLYHLLSGRVPFPGGSVLKKLDAHRTATADPLTGVPPALVAVVARMMARRPEDRFPSATEVADALEPFARGEVPELHSRPRRRVLAAVAAGVLALVGVVAAAVAYEVRRGNEVITIETDDPAVEVVMRRNGELIRIVDTKTNQTWEVDTQKMRLTPDGKELSIDLPGKEPLVIRRNGDVAVTIRRETRPPAPPIPPAAAADPGLVRTFTGHIGSIRSVTFSPDGKEALSGSGYPNSDGTVRLWDVATGRAVWTIDLQGKFTTVAFAPGDVVMAGDANAVIWLLDRKTGKTVGALKGHQDSVHDIAISPDGKLAASASADGTVRLWDLKTRTPLKVFRGHRHQVYAVAFSPDGRFVASTGGPVVVRVWDWEADREVAAYQPLPVHGQPSCTLAFTPDGRDLVFGHQSCVVVWTWQTGGKRRVEIPGDASALISVAVSPDGRRILTAGSEQVVRLWDFRTGRLEREYRGQKDADWSVAISPDGQYGLTGGVDRMLRLWRLPDPTAALPDSAGEVRVFRGHTDGLLTVAVSPDGKYAATAGSWPANTDPVIRLWEVASGREVRQFEGHESHIYQVAFSPDGKRLLSVSQDGSGRVWDVETGRELKLLASGAGGATFTKDAKAAVTCSTRVMLWDLETGAEQKRFDPITARQMRCLDLSPDGKTVAVGEWVTEPGPGQVRLWDVATGKVRATLTGHTNLIYAVRYAPDGKRLASACGDGTARIWDVAANKELHVLKHTHWVAAVAFSPDGRYLATGGDDRFVRIWDATTGHEVHRFVGHEHTVWSVAFTPDGRHVLSASADKTLRMWRLPATPAAPAAPASFPAAPHVEELHRIPFAYAGHHDVAADGSEFLAYTTAGDKRVAVIFDAATGKETGRFAVPAGEHVYAWFIPGSRDVLVSANLTLERWDRATGAKRADLTVLSPNCVPAPLPATGDVVAVWLGNAGGPGRHRVAVYDLRTGRERFRVDPQHAGSILGQSPRFSPDGKLLATTDTTLACSVIRVWDAAAGRLVRTIDVAGNLNCGSAFGPGGREIVADYGTTAGACVVGRWATESGEQLRATAFVPPTAYSSAAFLPGGQAVAYLVESDTVVRFLATDTGRLFAEYRPGGPIRSGVASSDGRFILYATDGELRVVRTPVPPRALPQPPPPVRAASNPPDRRALLAVTDFREAHGLDLAGLKAWVAALPAGFRPIDITARAGAVPPRFDAIAVADGLTPAVETHFDLDRTGGSNHTDFDKMARAGWALRVSCPFEDGAIRPRHHVWVRDGGGWFANGFTFGRAGELADQWRRDRVRPRTFYRNDADTGKGRADRPMGVLLGADYGQPWEFLPELTPADLAVRLTDARTRGWRPDALGEFGTGPDRTFALSVVPNPTGLGWEFRADLTLDEYEAELARQKAAGRRPLAVASAGNGAAVRYTAVWVEYSPPK